MAELGAHRTSMKSSWKGGCDGVICGRWGAVCVEKIDADFAVITFAHR